MNELSEREGKILAKVDRAKRVFKNFTLLLTSLYGLYIYLTFYNDLTNSENILGYCYAFFVANAIAAGGVFSLGRSSIIVNRNDASAEYTIHLCGFHYLCSAIIGLFSSAFAYLHLNATLPAFKTVIHESITFHSLSFLITSSAAISFFATARFFAFAIMEAFFKKNVA